MNEPSVYKIVFFAPMESAEAVKEAMFAAGAGRFDRYEHCAWQAAGTGQFRPLADAAPHIGRIGDLERVAELRVEMICRRARVSAALDALLAAHPYEEPAYEVIPVFRREDFDVQSP